MTGTIQELGDPVLCTMSLHINMKQSSNQGCTGKTQMHCYLAIMLVIWALFSYRWT